MTTIDAKGIIPDDIKAIVRLILYSTQIGTIPRMEGYLAGGSVRQLVHAALFPKYTVNFPPINDLDFFFVTGEDAEFGMGHPRAETIRRELIQAGFHELPCDISSDYGAARIGRYAHPDVRYPVEVMIFPGKNVEDVLTSFDWEICKFGYDLFQGIITHTEETLWDQYTGTYVPLQVGQIKGMDYGTLRRGFRFSDRFGTSISSDSMEILACSILGRDMDIHSTDERLDIVADTKRMISDAEVIEVWTT